jgi:transposase
MAISEAQYRLIEHCLPKQRGNVRVTNLRVLNAILYIVESNCSWRQLPRSFGNWHTVYTRVRRWTQSGVLDPVFTQLQRAQILRIRIEVAVDIPLGSVSADASSRSQNQPHGPSSDVAKSATPFMWLPREVERLRSMRASNSTTDRTVVSHVSMRQRRKLPLRQRTTEGESRRSRR